MPWPVYTERLLAGSVTDTWFSYTVPAGRRALIKSVVAISTFAGGLLVHVTAANFYVAAFNIQDVYIAHSIDVLCVAYAGEHIAAYLQGAAGIVNVTGWLLEDVAASTKPSREPELHPDWPAPGASS